MSSSNTLTTEQKPAEPDNATIDLAFVDEVVQRFGRSRQALIPILNALQDHYRYLPQPALRRLCAITDNTAADVIGVATFYSRFRQEPGGRHTISVCHGTACHVKGAPLITEALRRTLKLTGDSDTTDDGLFSVRRVDCLGCCTLAPVVQIDGVTYGHLTPASVEGVIDDFLRLQQRQSSESENETYGGGVAELPEIRIGVGSCCIAGGSMEVRRALEDAVREINAPVVIRPVGCVGMCSQTPLVEVVIPGEPPIAYARMKASDAQAVVRRHFRPRGFLRQVRAAVTEALDNLLTDESWQPVTRYAIDLRDGPICSFLGRQKHLATELYGSVNPLDLDGYLDHGGFAALRRCLTELSPEEVIDAIDRSGLRGRGGAGFPTGAKWRITRRALGDTRYVVCNGDEGDPGAFMDRMLLESYPFRVLEGAIIAAYAVGAAEAVVYIRTEYHLAVRRVREAIRLCRERGFVGQRILGSDFAVSLSIMEGAGAFVCGEETGLIASLEGRRGMPRLRPPYPAVQGLWGRPTCVNNVETLALVPWIIRHGPEAFAALGTDRSKGTKIFSLTGQVRYGGLIEVPMGTTIRQIVEEIGGGVPAGRKLKAVQIGGPSGGCVPAELADTPVDYEALTNVGAIMGSGGLVVLDDTNCMVDVARYFLEFTQKESCGKCTFCRVGTRRMLSILDRLSSGEGSRKDLQELEELAHIVAQASLCGLGQTAPNPVLSTLRYFRHEYDAHVAGICPAGKCRALITYRITDECIGCTKCAQQCPASAIELRPHQLHAIDPSRCIRCGTCREVCPVNAVVLD